MVSQNQLYTPISVNLGFLNVALSRQVGTAATAGGSATVRPHVAGTSSTPNVNVHPPPTSGSKTASEPSLLSSLPESGTPSPATENHPQTENSGYSIQLAIKTCIHGTLDAASTSKTPASLLVFEIDFGLFAQRASVEFRFRGRQSTVLQAIPSIPGVPSFPAGVSVLDYAPQSIGEESAISRVFSFPGGVKWDFKRRSVPRTCQFAFLLTRSDDLVFYLNFRPSLESSLKNANAPTLQLTSQPQSVTFNPTAPPYGEGELASPNSLGQMKGMLLSLIGPSHLMPDALVESPRQSSESLKPRPETTPASAIDKTGYTPLGNPKAEASVEHLDFDDPPTIEQGSKVEYICECGPLKSRWGQETTGCIRSSRRWLHESFHVPGAGIGLQGASDERHHGVYVVLGIFNKDSAVPREVVIPIEEDSIKRKISGGVRSLRGVRSFISLKTVSAFSLYKCDPKTGGHTKLVVDSRTENILRQLFLVYHAPSSPRDKAEGWRWRDWIRKNLNDGNDDPLLGTYSLQLQLKWSVLRISILTLTPCALSLAIGIWYQAVTGDVQTAWTVSSYIVTTGGLIIALLAIATASGQV